MRNNPAEGGEFGIAVDDHKHCKNNYFPSILSCIDKRTRENCDSGSEVGTDHSGLGGEGSLQFF